MNGIRSLFHIFRLEQIPGILVKARPAAKKGAASNEWHRLLRLGAAIPLPDEPITVRLVRMP